MKTYYRKRINRVKQALRNGRGPAAILLSSAPLQVSTRDQHHPFRQDSNFFYLTGALHQSAALLISTAHKKPLLLAQRQSPYDILWHGEDKSFEETAERTGAELHFAEDPFEEAVRCLLGHETLYYQSAPGTLGLRVASHFLGLPGHQRRNTPAQLIHGEEILRPLREIKDRQEILTIQKAAHITGAALQRIIPFMQHGTSEQEIAHQLDAAFRLEGGSPSFNAIVAAGKSAATLHYHFHNQPLKKNHPLMIDCGAAFEMYAADITRVFPIGGTFRGIYRDLYDVVLAAEKAAIQRVRAGVKVTTLQRAAQRVLAQGLIDLGVLKGKASDLLDSEELHRFFPHGIGHQLGLDVHDVGRMRGNTDGSRLKAGMVITIEPGLYFPRKAGPIPACGFRIEDDILVTETGYENLSECIPRERDTIEGLFA